MNKINDFIIKSLLSIERLKVQKDISLSEVSNWKVGGKAKVLVRPSNIKQIIALRRILDENNINHLVIGNTTNLLFSDDNIDVVLIQIGSDYSNLVIDDFSIRAQPGIWVPKLARGVMRAGLTGIEHTCGIPGTLGGLVVMNGGSQRKGIGDHVTCIKTVDNKGNIKNYTQKECLFNYRDSVFQKLDEIIVEVELSLAHSVDKKKSHSEMLETLQSRSRKFPRKLPNCGSVFVSNPAMYKEFGPPGKVIEACGLKGRLKGGAQISNSHANFIVNNGNATAKDILYLINYVRDKVFDKTGYLMKVEAKFITNKGFIEEI
ncbi:MAG: UDP-N-acetylmuramate dehydrogenase [Cocleimonas sp.]|jgi:UDP-N-acetylmuramate dehydrogenase